MRLILQIILKYLAAAILRKYHPEIIAITGSVGKTSAKEAVFKVLEKSGAKRNIKNYNNELGVPLTIIGAEAGGKNIFKWVAAFLRALNLIIFKNINYPPILILEMGVDQPGDMDYLLSFIKPKIGIFTAIGPAHLEKFKTQEKILAEKSKLILSLPKTSFAIINHDQEEILNLREGIKAKCITYGFGEGADLKAKDITYSKEGTNFVLEYGDTNIPIELPPVPQPQVYALLAAAACGIIKNMAFYEIKAAMESYELPKGRGVILKGIKNTVIIDDTYNASPQSMASALENLKNLSAGGRCIAVLGDMLELGSISGQAHLNIGRTVLELGIDCLFTFGELGKKIAKGAKDAGMAKNKIFSFLDKAELIEALQEQLQEGDTILVKGSRGMKMEEIINKIQV